MILHMAAASARAPSSSRIRTIRTLRAALELLEGEKPQPLKIKPQHATALREIASSLDLAAEHAKYLAAEAEAIIDRGPMKW